MDTAATERFHAWLADGPDVIGPYLGGYAGSPRFDALVETCDRLAEALLLVDQVTTDYESAVTTAAGT